MIKFGYVVIAIMIILSSCITSKQVKKEQELLNTELISVKVDWSTENFLKPYIDSLQSVQGRENMPDFLSNDCFDYEHQFFWKNRHAPQSFRKEIILSISNIKVVQLLLKNKDFISNKECDQLVEIPYGGNGAKMEGQELTNIDLLELRLSELSK